ncbi:hypothetical protein SUNI508_06939 [Seiridium unicorne]|uniref:PPPDE domain-containing protein n=1 Tax=Seiridium unicorne TaxID=138068 RepID=A0ABR2UZ13_9PEZI
MKEVFAGLRERHVLGSVKKVYGGAFSGHAEAYREAEEAIINCFVGMASSFRYLPGKTLAANRRSLSRKSTAVVSKIKELFEDEIDTHLQQFANMISNVRTPLRWDLNTNNCQHFSQNLLKQSDIPNLFHRLPGNYFKDEALRKKRQWPYPRYLLSFGFDIDTPLALLRPQDRSLIWSFYHQKRDECDMIEFAEQFRTKSCPAPTDAWEILCDEDFGSESDNHARTRSMSLVDALWILPRDSISILHTALMRSWARHSTNEGYSLTQRQWVLNRLRILHQIDVFASLSRGLATAIRLEMGNKIEFLHRHYFPTAELYGNLHINEKVAGSHGVFFITGRERDRWKRELRHEFGALMKRKP